MCVNGCLCLFVIVCVDRKCVRVAEAYCQQVVKIPFRNNANDKNMLHSKEYSH